MNQFIKEVKIALKLAQMNLKTGVEGTYLGILWYILDPLIFFTMIIFIRSFFLGTNFNEYPLYLIIGLTMYHYFSNSTTRIITFAKSTLEYAKKSEVSYNCLFMSKIFQSLYLHIFELIWLIIFVIIFEGSILGIAYYIFIILFFFTLLNSGISFILSIIGAYFPDFIKIWQIFLQMAIFITPVFLVFDKTSLMYKLNLFNPLFYFLEISRNLIIHNSAPSASILGIMLLVSLTVFFVGYFIFKRFNKYFPELAE